MPSCDCEVSVRFLDRRQVTLPVRSTDTVDMVLRKVCSQVNIPVDLTYAFGLCLVRSSPKDEETEEVLSVYSLIPCKKGVFLPWPTFSNVPVQRQLYRFECPVISLEEANKLGAPHFLLFRKW
ncbi:unnamed protein product [Schistocephalus solidus]|uniref:Sortin nexin 17/31 FERM domain-containing protein n=1 Tax=Schistocephalus solidus TaxID=70667 RepID=A0A3P7DL42_SCHSO|nr:unnamed protein product [Schistocephalus solidus]